MMNTLEKLVYMANQIARNFEAIGHDHAVEATEDHIASFWDPRMKAQIFAHLKAGGDGLSPIALKALTELRDKGAPEHQTRATVFAHSDEVGGSDAG